MSPELGRQLVAEIIAESPDRELTLEELAAFELPFRARCGK
jgi:hypothetical protein